MKQSILGSVAAITLIVSVGLANAQSPGGQSSGGLGSGGQSSGGMSAPAGGSMKAGDAPAAAQPRKEGGSMSGQPALKGTSAETTAPPASKNGVSRAERDARPSDKAGEMKVDSAAKPAAGSTTSPTAAAKDAPAAALKDAKGPATDAKSANPTADNKAAADSKTTGNATTSATANLPAEKRSQITTAIKQEKVEEVTNVNFNISVGTAVPASVHYYPLPSRIVEIYPEWRGYDYILVRGKYIILRPQTREIVYIIEG